MTSTGAPEIPFPDELQGEVGQRKESHTGLVAR